MINTCLNLRHANLSKFQLNKSSTNSQTWIHPGLAVPAQLPCTSISPVHGPGSHFGPLEPWIPVPAMQLHWLCPSISWMQYFSISRVWEEALFYTETLITRFHTLQEMTYKRKSKLGWKGKIVLMLLQLLLVKSTLNIPKRR